MAEARAVPARHRWRDGAWLLFGLSVGAIVYQAVPGTLGVLPRALGGLAGAALAMSRFRGADLERAAVQLPFAMLAGVAVYLGLPEPLGWQVRLMAGWVTSALVLLVFAFAVIFRSDPLETKRRAEFADPGQRAVLGLVVAASVVSIVASAFVPGAGLEAQRRLVVGLRLLTVLSAWLVTQASYTLHYAHLYYGGAGRDGGLEFPRRPGDTEPFLPDDYDFAYFAFTLGTSLAASDVSISSRPIRRAAFWHNLVSFAFNTAIFANALNLIYEFFR